MCESENSQLLTMYLKHKEVILQYHCSSEKLCLLILQEITKIVSKLKICLILIHPIQLNFTIQGKSTNFE